MLSNGRSFDEVAELAVGGEFEGVGRLEHELLLQWGLKEDSYVIDVGCGSGRLTHQLSSYPSLKYLGIELVPELLEYARNLAKRPDWRFEPAKDYTIPEKDGVADIVCFFSVFTHLFHEQSYAYLQEAKRVLKPSGKVIFSYDDFTVPTHWSAFEFNIQDLKDRTHPLTIFIGKDAIKVWASHLGMKVLLLQDGDKPHIPLSQPIVFKSGAVLEGLANFGQSVCVLSRD